MNATVTAAVVAGVVGLGVIVLLVTVLAQLVQGTAHAVDVAHRLMHTVEELTRRVIALEIWADGMKEGREDDAAL